MTKRSENYNQSIEILHQGGIFNPIRIINQIKDVITFLNLNLSGLTILTEAASGPYVVTPIIASLANASKVLALTCDSKYADVNTVIAQTRALESLCGIEVSAQIFTDRSFNTFQQADIITNLGFVRPIDASLIKIIKSGAVIPYMCEAWEYRPGDVDLEACHDHGIPVLGTNEHYPGLNVFSYCGPLLGKILFEAGLEILGNRFLILSNDSFGTTLFNYLNQNGADVFLASGPSQIKVPLLEELDAVIVADIRSNIEIIGPNGWVDPNLIATFSPNAFVLQYAGLIDVESVFQAGLECIPDYEVGSFRMWRTLAYLSPRPVIDLHAAGLKVGELMWRELRKGIDSKTVIKQLSMSNQLCQRIDF